MSEHSNTRRTFGFCSKRVLTDQIQVVGARVVIVLNIANIVVTNEGISVVQVIPNGRRISIVLASLGINASQLVMNQF